MELKRYLQIVWKWRWLIVLCTLLAAGVSYGVSSIVPSVYRASTSLLVSAGGVTGNDYTTLLANQQLAATYTELLVKRPIIEAAAMELVPGLGDNLETGTRKLKTIKDFVRAVEAGNVNEAKSILTNSKMLTFSSADEVKKANLPKGTKIIINGKLAIWE